MVLSYFFLEVLVQALMLGLFLIRRKVNCTQRRRVLFTSEYYARYSGSLDWGRIFLEKIRQQFSLTYLTAFCLSCFKGLHLVLWILIAYYMYSFRILPLFSASAKTAFSRNHNQCWNRLCLHRWILNNWRKSSMERFERRPVYPRGTLSMAAGRSGYITAFEYLWDNNLTQKRSSYVEV